MHSETGSEAKKAKRPRKTSGTKRRNSESQTTLECAEKNSSLLLNLIEIYENIRVTLVKLNLPQTMIAYNRKRLDKAKYNELTDTITWLTAFHTIRILDYEEARKWRTEEQWANYDNLGIKSGMFEVDELNKAKALLIGDWKCRPKLLRHS